MGCHGCVCQKSDSFVSEGAAQWSHARSWQTESSCRTRGLTPALLSNVRSQMNEHRMLPAHSRNQPIARKTPAELLFLIENWRFYFSSAYFRLVCGWKYEIEIRSFSLSRECRRRRQALMNWVIANDLTSISLTFVYCSLSICRSSESTKERSLSDRHQQRVKWYKKVRNKKQSHGYHLISRCLLLKLLNVLLVLREDIFL